MKIRTTKPTKGNKFYITKAKGGYSQCIEGYPKDNDCNVLSNCVGYACGRFNEIIGSMKYPTLNCNAENFIERAKSLGLQISNTPTLGGIMVWQKGNTLSGNDGAGHVAIVEKIYDTNHIMTSESAYGSSAFYTSDRRNDNGRWGMQSGYKFRGCVINPSVKESPKKTNYKRVSEKGVFTANRTLAVKNAPSTSAKTEAYYYNGESLTYDSYVVNEGYVWLSYVSNSGARRYIAWRINGGTKYGVIV